MRDTGTDLACHGTSASRYTLAPGPHLQAPVAANTEDHRAISAYNWDLGINGSVKTQKCSDNYQNMRIILACATGFKKKYYLARSHG